MTNNDDAYSNDIERLAQPVEYRGHMATCGECGRLHVQGVACEHGEDDK